MAYIDRLISEIEQEENRRKHVLTVTAIVAISKWYRSQPPTYGVRSHHMTEMVFISHARDYNL